MYEIVRSKKYRRSIKKLKASGSFSEYEFDKVIDILATGETLPKKHQDHALSGSMSGYRECHVKSDLLLVYYKEDKVLILVLVDIGSHSDLF